MNITVLSLISFSLINYSPAFVNNDLSFIQCHFNRFISLLFFNPNYLNVKDTMFTNGLGGVIHINSVYKNGNQWKYNQTFNNEKLFNNNEVNNVYEAFAVTFDKCLFLSIDTPSPVLITNKMVSVYFTDSNFVNCKSNQGVLSLKHCRCVTITHVCSFNSQAGSESAFLYMDCKPEDFFIFLYSSIATDSTYQSTPYQNVKCLSGDQYIRCINMTKFPNLGFLFDAPQCFNFGLSNIINCNQYSFQISGNIKDKHYFFNNINVMTNGANQLFRLASGYPFSVSILDSVLINGNGAMLERAQVLQTVLD